MNGLITIVRLAILLVSFMPAPVRAAAVLSESPTAITPGNTVVAAWSSIDTPTPLDWIGLYLQGAQDEHDYEPNSWVYVSNCAQLRDPGLAARASGNCSVVVPSDLTPGVYELHLLANDGFTRLARSDPFTVTGPIQIVSFKINNGAASTSSHTVTLDFATAPINSGNPNPVPDAFRAVEGGSIQELFAKEFVPLTSATSAPFTLALRGRDGARYGGRPVLLQVKAGSVLSFPRIDSIRLDPVVRDYTIGSEEAFAYAQRRGYVVTTTSGPVISDSDDPCNQCPVGTRAQAGDHPCTVTTTIIFFSGRELRPFWRLKKVDPTFGHAGAINQNVFRWIFSDTTPPDPSLGGYTPGGNCFFGLQCASTGIACFGNLSDPTAQLTFEGPIEDDFVDPRNPWKNAFTFFFRLITPRTPNAFPRR
jgi:hypothetical protein